MTTVNHAETMLSAAEDATFPPDVFEPNAFANAQPDDPLEEVSYPTLKTAIKACVPLVILAALGALLVAGVVLGGKLMLIGFAVAFLMIMFIGLPLMIASITDALEGQQSA